MPDQSLIEVKPFKQTVEPQVKKGKQKDISMKFMNMLVTKQMEGSKVILKTDCGSLKSWQKTNLESNESNQSVLNELIGIEDPDALMVEILDVLSETEATQVLVTTTLLYINQNIQCSYSTPICCCYKYILMKFQWINFHWGQTRQYTFQEVVEVYIKVFKWDKGYKLCLLEKYV